MDEGGKVRVVRCPKCGKLLPELPDIPVYRCGGCNATLQAKHYQSVRTDASSEKSDEVKVRFCENSESSSGKRGSLLNEMCETDRESDGADVMRKEIVMSERMEDSSSRPSSSRGENKVVDDCNLSREFEEPEPSRYDRGRYRRSSKAPVENWVVTDNLDSRSHELIRRNINDSGEAKALVENVSGGQRLRPVPDRWAVERERPFAFRSGQRAAAEGSRYSPYSDEGPSSHHSFSPYENGEQTKDHNLDGPGRVDALEKDRAELLRKLDELRDQLTRSCDVSDHPKERVPANRMLVPPNSYDGHDAWFKEGTFPADRGSSQLYAPDNPLRRPTYLNNEPHIPSVGRHDMDVQSCYPPVNAQNEVLGYRESFGPQVPMRAPHHARNQYPQRPSNSYLSSLYIGADPDLISTYAPYGFYEQPPCSCLHCYNKHWQAPVQVPPTVLCNRQLPGSATNQMFYHLDNPGSYGSHGPELYNHRGANAPFHSFEPQPHVRKPSDLELDMSGFRRPQLQRSVLAKGNQRSCRPIAGGAPFITCRNCFKLLQLPQNLPFTEGSQCKLTERNRCMLRCGACSNVISFTHDGKNLSFAFAVETKGLMLEGDNDSSDGMKEGLPVDGYTTKGTKGSNSDGYDSSTYNIQSTDAKPISSSPFDVTSEDPIGKESMLNVSESERRQGLSLSSVSSEDEEYSDSMIAQRDVSNSMEQPLKVDLSSSVPGSPLHEHFECSPTNQVVNKFGKGSRSERLDQEKILLNNGTTRQNSVKAASVATEMDCSYNEYNSGMFLDSAEVSKEDRHKISKGSESFFAGLIKKSFKDFGRSSQSFEDDQPNVSVNGQPIPDRLVKKAEKKSGRIQPGHYWYDYRAGFWGVMGHQCLGIIPPFIEEFNYPMPKNCSGGDTGVFVNARELHQKDLDLLSSRGLRTSRDKSYVVEISGRVSDEATGVELDGLGKLAPTVEKAKHGFGMRVPRSMAQIGTLSGDR
ncbi:protein ENHANCED DISEASE RESISTANCE 4-like protein [Cinnamomum micranthum f. kanehirae]|uniref:Protein ENHANCED DISEASE RESISTANCE 4-like protein n=1 Tax=Cinnamomum micranthum f. kanehirae TaxID=337451 RepID=A0A3S3PL95_9MAGN|nr:protein ENHANCED DISEASE RESISTANCE 4-like protein [Cinnamomum micranthum f. kanehirae]